MTTEKVEPIEIIIKDREASGSPKPVKKEKNPNRVAGGKKGVEARRMKEELLIKENEKLKELAMKKESPILLKESSEATSSSASGSLSETNSFNNKKIIIEKKKPINETRESTSSSRESTSSRRESSNNYSFILFLTIGIGGLGLYFYKKRNEVDMLLKQDSSTLVEKVEKPITEKKEIQKKEIDPFDF